MKTSDLVFVGIKNSVVALNRATGELVWETPLAGGQFVNVVVQDDAVLATNNGEIFCLDPVSGKIRWHNRLKGFGIGLATIAGTGIQGQGGTEVLAEVLRAAAAARHPAT